MDIDSIDDVTSEMPTPTSVASESEPRDNADIVDSRGTPFDPNIHITDSDGDPKLTSKGRCRLKRGKKQPGEHGSAAKSRVGEGAKSNTRAAGQLIAENIFAVGQIVGGQEWAPFEDWNPDAAKQYGINERATQYEAWANYCESKGIKDIPPGLMVVFVMGQYVGMRMAMPKTQSRLQKAKTWLVQKYVAWRSKRGRRGKRSASSEADIWSNPGGTA